MARMDFLRIALAPALLTLACGETGSDDDGDTGTGDTSSSDDAADDINPTLDDGETLETSGDPSDTMPADSSSSGGGGSSGGGSSESGEESSTGSAACEGMSFFATSVGSGRMGGNLGGLEGADATCQALADAVGQGGCTWHAYLSTAEEDARDRIGSGPWFNAMGDMIAADVDSLHTDMLSNGDPQHIFDENGMEVPGNEHDILTGSQEDGTLLDGFTCSDWTSDAGNDSAQVGHSDIPDNPQFSPSWNSAHDTPGCGADDLQSTGGAGRLYCFAI
jgi:hypothetical protein